MASRHRELFLLTVFFPTSVIDTPTPLKTTVRLGTSQGPDGAPSLRLGQEPQEAPTKLQGGHGQEDLAWIRFDPLV